MDIVWDIKNLIAPLDRARRVVLGTPLEHFYHVPRRIAGTFTSISIVKHEFFAFFMDIVWGIKNLIAPLDRAHRVVLGTWMEHF